MYTRVDTDGLRAAGTGLMEGAAGAPGTAPHCPPATPDPVSVSAANALSRWSTELWAQFVHSGRVRESGGESVVATAGLIGLVDAANARMIAGVADGGAVGAPVVPALLGDPPEVSAPATPPVPVDAAPTPLSAEEIVAHVHAGPGPAHLRAFAEHWRATLAPLILATADETRRHGAAVDAHWEDGRQRAGRNTAEHADWLESSLHPSALDLADAADRVARHTDAVIENTPRPEELADLKHRYNVALADYRASGGVAAAPAVALGAQWTRTVDTTIAGYQTFAAAATVQPDTDRTRRHTAPPILRPDVPAATSDGPPTPAPPLRHRDGDDGEHGGANPGADGDETPDAPVAAHPVPPEGPGGPPPLAGPSPVPGDTTSTGAAANIAGTLVGAGIGTLSQTSRVGGAMGGLGGVSPMSALSGLSALPGLGGGPPPTDAPQSSAGGGDSPFESPDGEDFGTGGTTPAAGGGVGGGAGGAPTSSSVPALSNSSAAGPSVGYPASPVPTSAGTAGFGGGGMFAPPLAGGLGRGGDDESKSDDKRRVVHRPIPNTEPVFGEVERKRSARRVNEQEEST